MFVSEVVACENVVPRSLTFQADHDDGVVVGQNVDYLANHILVIRGHFRSDFVTKSRARSTSQFGLEISTLSLELRRVAFKGNGNRAL